MTGNLDTPTRELCYAARGEPDLMATAEQYRSVLWEHRRKASLPNPLHSIPIDDTVLYLNLDPQELVEQQQGNALFALRQAERCYRIVQDSRSGMKVDADVARNLNAAYEWLGTAYGLLKCSGVCGVWLQRGFPVSMLPPPPEEG